MVEIIDAAAAVAYGAYRHRFEAAPRMFDPEPPVTFAEKLTWRKMFDRRAIISQACDKRVTRNRAPPALRFPVLGAWTTVDGLIADWNTLPATNFVIRGNGHDRNYLIADKATVDQEAMRIWLQSWLNTPYNEAGGEWGYSQAQVGIYAQAYQPRAVEVQVYVFDGVAKLLTLGAAVGMEETAIQRRRITLDDSNQLTDVLIRPAGTPFAKWTVVDPPPLIALATVARLNAARIAAVNMAAGYDFVRVDFLALKAGGAVIDDMTVYPFAGTPWITPMEYDEVVSGWWTLPAGAGPVALT